MHTVGAASARRAFASRPVAVLTLCACVVVVGACGAPTAIAFFEEVAWYAQGVADEEMRSTLTTSAASVGVRLEPIVSAEPEPRVALAAALRDRRPSLAVVVPLLSLEVDELAAEHPGVHFVAIGVPAAAASSARPTNVTAVSFDSDGAFERAGRVMGLYVRSRDGARVAVIERRPVSARAVERVVAGIQEVAGGDALLRRELQSGADRVRLRRLVEGVVRDGALVVFLDVGDLAAAGLATLADQGALAVVTNWGNRPGYEGTLLLTVEEDLAAAVRAGLQRATERASDPSPASAAVAVAGQVVWRLGEPPPATAATLLDARVAARPGSTDVR